MKPIDIAARIKEACAAFERKLAKQIEANYIALLIYL
jgi:hypothetical protein